MTQRFLLIGTRLPHATVELLQVHQRAEMELVWRHYASGFIRELYQRAGGAGVVMILEAAEIEAVAAFADELPLKQAGLIDITIMPLEPFTMWRALFA